MLQEKNRVRALQNPPTCRLNLSVLGFMEMKRQKLDEGIKKNLEKIGWRL